MKLRLNVLHVLLPTNPNDGATLVSSLQALLVQEEFYSIKQCTIIGLLSVSLLLRSVRLVSNTV